MIDRRKFLYAGVGGVLANLGGKAQWQGTAWAQGFTDDGAGPPPQSSVVDKAIAHRGGIFSHSGQSYRLADILVPSLSSRSRPQPYADEARLALSKSLTGAALHIAPSGEPDRWGRVPAYVYKRHHDRDHTYEPRHSLQYHLVSLGAARVWPQTDDTNFIRQLFIAEAKARQEELGLWAFEAYRMRQAENASKTVGGVHLIEGRVLQASERRGRAYLNFGEDYRDDFTVTAPWRLVRRWEEEGFIDWMALEGAVIRTRGYVRWINGPSITLAHPLQIEGLEAVSG